MTQIKLRRDTSANFTSKNPVLGIGEPAYETDTKKLKIGDGTTAYTQLEYFTAGGGSSTNITATLPLKIVDGVISLEVDGQTIQIVDGKLHANLDELSNTVNTLSGDVEVLSDDLHQTQADVQSNIENITNLQNALPNKQDKLNPVAPLGINQTTIRSVTNGTFLTDTSVTLNSAFGINYTTNENARALIYVPGSSSVGATPTSFIQIPFTLGDLISFPFEKDNDANIGLVFGYWKGELFYPTMLYKTNTTYGPDNSAYAPFAFVSEAGKSSLENIATYYGGSSAVSKSALVYNQSIPLNATNYIQVTKNAGVPTVNMWFTIAGATWPNSGFIQRMYTSDATVLENLNKTNVCLLLSNNTSKAINLTKVTRRELGDTVLDPTPDALTTALSTYSNSFDATAKVVTNDLSLAIGSGLSVVDGKLHANLDDKQDKFETQAPLSISSNSVTTSVDPSVTETAESWTGGGATNSRVIVDISDLNIDANSNWTLHLSGYMGDWANSRTDTAHFSILTDKETIFTFWHGSGRFRLGINTHVFNQIPYSTREFYYEITYRKDATQFTFNGTNLVSSDPLLISEMSREMGQTPYTTLAGKGKLKSFGFPIFSETFQRIDKDISKSYFETDGVKYPITSVQGANTLKLGIGSGLSVVDGKLTSTGGDKVTVLSNEYTAISPVPTNGVWYKSLGNGYIVARFMSSSGNQFCQLAVNATGKGSLDDKSIYDQTAFSQGGNNGFTLLLPISSTQYYAVNTNFGHGLQWARFIPFITA